MTAITLLDGSIGQELVKRSDDRVTHLWSTRVMMDHPDMVGQVHDDYFRAGATVATANTYAVHSSRLARVDLEEAVPDLLRTAAAQAREARDRHGSGRVAGALGPLLASYRPDLEPDPEQAAERFGEIVSILDPHVDLFIAETVSSLKEAEGVLRGAEGTEKPVWLSFTVMDDDGTRLRSGENLADAGPLLTRFAPAAVLVNCSRPEAFPAAMEILRDYGLPFGGYANGFTHISDGFLKDAPTVDALEQRTDLTPAAYAEHVMGWIDQGATIVGGCCEVGPDHITELARRLGDAGHKVI